MGADVTGFKKKISMGISAAIIFKGIRHRFAKRKRTSSFPALSWLQEKRLKHQDEQQLKKVAIGRLKFLYKRPYEFLHTYRELFEDEIYKFSSTNQAPLIVDCGANIGLSVLYFKSLFPMARVIAYEPDENNFSVLKENIRINNYSDVDCRQAAVWVHNGAVSFQADGSQGSQIITGESGNTIPLKAERLADLIRDKQIDFLKIDIEGAEAEVIADCDPYLANVRNLFVEYHGRADETQKLAKLLAVLDHHFKVYIKLAADNLSLPFVQRKTGYSFDVQLNIFCYR
jgi:FkbM family methyltransferase